MKPLAYNAATTGMFLLAQLLTLAQSAGSKTMTSAEMDYIPIERSEASINWVYPVGLSIGPCGYDTDCKGNDFCKEAASQALTFENRCATKLANKGVAYNCIELCGHNYLIATIYGPMSGPGDYDNSTHPWKNDGFFWFPVESHIDLDANMPEEYIVTPVRSIVRYSTKALLQYIINCYGTADRNALLHTALDVLVQTDITSDAVVLRSVNGVSQEYAKYCHPQITQSRSIVTATFYAHTSSYLYKYVIKVDLAECKVRKANRSYISIWNRAAT